MAGAVGVVWRGCGNPKTNKDQGRRSGMKRKRRRQVPLNVVLPVAAAAIVIGSAFGLGMVFLEIENQIGKNESIAAALLVTLAIMGVAIFLTTRPESA